MKRLLLVLVIVLVACGSEPTSRTTDPTNHDVGWGRDVQEIILTNGTLCVVARNTDKAVAITCDWGAR